MIKNLSKKEKKHLFRIVLSLFFFVLVFVGEKIFDLSLLFGKDYGFLFTFLLYLGVFLYIGYDVIRKAIRGILNGQALDENFLMFIASLGAFCLALFRGFSGRSVDGFEEGCAVIIFYQVGEFFQNYATNKSRKSIESLMEIRPDFANLVKDNEIEVVDPEEVKVGDIIVVKPGEKIPLDGKIIKGSTSLDTKALTGESIPKDVFCGDRVLSGSINLSGLIEVEVEKEFYDSTVNKILDLIENASDKKSKTENFISKFAKYYTPIVVICALVLGIVPSIIFGNWDIWIYRALNFLVVSCPCALVISVPLSFFAGIGLCSKNNILIKGSEFVEKLNDCNVFVFDKTGTLTKGVFKVSGVYPEKDREEILRLARIAEKNSLHPIAKSILSCCDTNISKDYILTDFSGLGIRAEGEDEIILCGNKKLLDKFGVFYPDIKDSSGTIVYLSRNGIFKGYIVISDEIKEESFEVISYFKKSGYKTIMLTGDRREVAKVVSSSLGLSYYKSNLLPHQKVEFLNNYIENKKRVETVCFVGDGINDAPSLMRADLGIAMGGVGSDAAIDASDVVLMKDNLKDILKAKKIAKKTMSIARQNIIFALSVKAIILILSSLGLANMWMAVFGDVGVAFIAILNAMRVGKDKY